MTDRLLSQLGLCRKAGRLVCGFDAVSEAIAKNTVFLVIAAQDLSPKSKKEIEYVAAKAAIEVIAAPATMDEIEWKTGKRAGVLAVADKGLAESVRKILTAQTAVNRVNEED